MALNLNELSQILSVLCWRQLEFLPDFDSTCMSVTDDSSVKLTRVIRLAIKGLGRNYRLPQTEGKRHWNFRHSPSLSLSHRIGGENLSIAQFMSAARLECPNGTEEARL